MIFLMRYIKAWCVGLTMMRIGNKEDCVIRAVAFQLHKDKFKLPLATEGEDTKHVLFSRLNLKYNNKTNITVFFHFFKKGDTYANYVHPHFIKI